MTIETIQITDAARLRVVADQDADCPRGDWHMLTGFVKLGDKGDWLLVDVPAVYDDPIGIEAAYDRFDEARYDYVGPGKGDRGGPYRLRAFNEYDLTARWARIFHGLHIEYDAEHGGYWFVAGADAATYATPVTYSRALFRDNWPDLQPGSPESLAKQAEVIEGERETYRQWADGEVYGVILERATAMAPVVRNEMAGVWDLRTPLTDDEIELSWDEAESIWGVYLDHDYTPQVVALECFDLTPEEKECLSHPSTEEPTITRGR